MLSGYLIWHYGRGLRATVKIARNFLAFSLHLFSTKELVASFFAPWKRIVVERRGWLFSQGAFSVMWANLLSRILGAMVRSVIIVTGFFFSILVATVDAALIVLWIAGPFLPPLLLITGVTLLAT